MQNKIASGSPCALLLASMAALCVSSAAEAAPRYDRDSDRLAIDVDKTSRTEGLAARKNSKHADDPGPAITANDVIEIEGEIEEIRDVQIQQYKLLIADTDPKSKEMPDLMFRLAERYAQKQRYERFQAMELYPKIDSAKPAHKGALLREQKGYFKGEKAALGHSLAVYKKLAESRRYKNYPRMDEVLFYYGYTLDRVKRITDSRKIFHQLIKNYPNSKYIPQAHLSFAEYFFEKGDLENAAKFYDMVLHFPKSPIYAYGMYKRGWVYLNQDRAQDALETFFKVANLTKGNKKTETINRAAKKDFVRAYAEVGRAERAYQAFQRLDKGYALTMLKILGTLYLDQGAADKAILTYRQLIGLRSKSPEVCEWQGNVVNAMLSAGSQAQKSEEIIRLVKVYAAHKKSKILRGGKLAECRDNAQGTAGEMAKIWHVQALKTMNLQTLDEVAKLYGVYLHSFPSAKDIGKMRYHYSDLLWDRARFEKKARLATMKWERAARSFTQVVQGGKVTKPFLKEAAYAAVLAWKNALEVDPTTRAPTATLDDASESAPIPKPRAIGDRESKMIAAFDVYIDYINDPKDDELVMMKFLKARIYWRHDHLQKSLPLFLEIVGKHSKHETALYSANILLDSMLRLKEYRKMNKVVKNMLKRKKFLEDKQVLRARLQKFNLIFMAREAKKLQEAGKHVECGRAYLAIFSQSPKADGVDKVLYNAGVCFEDGKSIGLAIKMYSDLDRYFPESILNQKALVRMGSAYASIVRYEKAAEKYELYAKRYGGEKDAPAVLNNAVTYRKGIGHDKAAIGNIESFVRSYKKQMKEQAASALFGLAGIYEKQGKEDEVVRAYKRYIAEIGKSGGLDRLLIANAKLGALLWKQSCKTEATDGACVRIKRERATTRSTKKRGDRSLSVPTQCGPASKIKLTVLGRDRRLVKGANQYFQAALRLVDAGAVDSAPDSARKAAAIYWMAASRFYLNGERYEQFLAMRFPSKLDFSVRNAKKKNDSERRFLKWFTDKDKLATEVVAGYGEVKEIRGGGAAWAVAAAARVGQVSQNFSDGLFTAEIPKDVRTGPYAQEGVESYCDALTEKAAPLEDLSVNAFGFCLKLSTEVNWFNRWSRLCEKELGQIRPAEFPTATEFHGPPIAAPEITDTQSLIAEIAH